MPRKTPGPPCSVCQAPSVAKGLCDKHYRRWQKYGDTTATLRPDDWGKRESHPLYGQWTWTNRCRQGRSPGWNDFDAFVADVGERPSKQHRLRRHDNSKPWGPSNFYWREVMQGRHYSLETAEGRKEYQKVWRANNRLRSKNNDLRAKYGLSLDEYDALMEKQGGQCAICSSNSGMLCVDHCHDSGAVRGLLCHQCNRALGMLKDDPALLKRAIKYLTGSLVAPT